MGMIEWIIGHVIDLSLEPPPSPQGQTISQVSKPNPLMTWLVFLAWPVPILSDRSDFIFSDFLFDILQIDVSALI